MTSYSERHESYCDTEDKQTNCVWVVFLYSSAAIKVGACRALAQLFEQVEGSVLRPHLPSVYVALSKLLQEVSQRNIALIFVNILLLGHWFEVIICYRFIYFREHDHVCQNGQYVHNRCRSPLFQCTISCYLSGFVPFCL